MDLVMKFCSENDEYPKKFNVDSKMGYPHSSKEKFDFFEISLRKMFSDLIRKEIVSGVFSSSFIIFVYILGKNYIIMNILIDVNIIHSIREKFENISEGLYDLMKSYFETPFCHCKRCDKVLKYTDSNTYVFDETWFVKKHPYCENCLPLTDDDLISNMKPEELSTFYDYESGIGQKFDFGTRSVVKFRIPLLMKENENITVDEYNTRTILNQQIVPEFIVPNHSSIDYMNSDDSFQFGFRDEKWFNSLDSCCETMNLDSENENDVDFSESDNEYSSLDSVILPYDVSLSESET